MKTKALFILLSLVLIFAFVTIPNHPGTAYPPSTPLPPIEVEMLDPEWVDYRCLPYVWIQVGWYDPPDNYPPFSFSNPGGVIVSHGSQHESYDLEYYGIDERGWHIWEVEFPRPAYYWTMMGYVRSVANYDFWIEPGGQEYYCYLVDIPYLTR